MLTHSTLPEGVVKTCPRCGEAKTPAEFNRDRKRPDGLQVYCKACLKIYRDVHKERIAAVGKAYRESNRDRLREQKREWKRTHRDHCNAKNREWRRDNREKVQESNRRYRESNLEAVRERSRRAQAQFQSKYPEKVRERARAWREKNQDKTKQYRRANRHRDRAYYAEHKDEIRGRREALCQWCVYRIEFSSGAFYIGSSNRPDLRFNAHKSRGRRGVHTVVLNEQDWETAAWRVLVECETETKAIAAEYAAIEEHMDDPKCLNTQVKEKRSSKYYVYVIQSEQVRVGKRGDPLPGFFYVGMTVCPARRLREHNGLYANGKHGNPKGGRYTSRHRPWVARACYGPYLSRSEALKAEYALKRGKRGKARCHWTPKDSPWCRGEGPAHPWVSDPTGWRPPKQ